MVSRSKAADVGAALNSLVERSRPAAAALTLIDLRALRLNAEFVGPGLDPPYMVQAGATGRFAATETTCGIQIEYDLAASTEAGQPVWHAAVVLHLEYHLVEGATMPDADALDAYASTAAPFAAHPFAREAVYSLTSRLGVPPFVLPTMRSAAATLHVQPATSA
jgi:hypothetical protein